MLKKLKVFYWELRATKGSNVIHMFRSVIAEAKLKLSFCLVDKKTSKKHSLPGNLIVSLTSYPPRFVKLHLTIMSLLDQKIQPDKIILWVAHDDEEYLPEKVLKLANNHLFEIRTCNDLGPAKKIIPAIEHYPDSFVVTADDDIFYSKNWLYELVHSWSGNHNHIMAHRVHEITFNENGLPDPYSEWNFDIKHGNILASNFATGIGGVLYPPGSLDKRVLNTKVYLELCSKADDVWLYWMARLNNTTVINTPWDFEAISWVGSQQAGLVNQNVHKGRNDLYIQNMIKSFDWPN